MAPARGGADARRRSRAAYREACSTIGREVRVHLPAGDVRRGHAPSASTTTAPLVVRTARARGRFAAGDVVHVRPATAGGAGMIGA